VVDSNNPNNDMRSTRITANSYKGRLLRQVPIIIIDEVGMLHVDDIYVINTLLKDLHSTGVRFGRVLMIFTGDVKQIMPIVPGADPLGERQANASFFFSGDYRVSTKVCLTDNMRVREGADQAHFLAWQLNIGMDRYEHVEFPNDTARRHTRFIRLPSRFVRFNEEAFIREVYSPEVLEGDPLQLMSRVILSPVNSVVDQINRRVTAMMPPDRPSQTYLSVNTPDAHDVYDPTSAVFAIDNLQSIESADIPVHALHLIVGMPVMCMQNLDVANGICNGTTMIVERLGQNIVWCRVNTRFGQRLQPFAATKFTYNDNGFKFTRVQLPLRVAFCVTVYRAQGGTYERVAFHSLRQLWAHGALFVAVTRTTTPEGLTILCDPEFTIAAHDDYVYGTTRNVVHPWVSGRGDTTQPATQAAPRPPHVAENEDTMETSYGPEFAFYDQRS
jgi:ATP-dependent DNA helicase PIF1